MSSALPVQPLAPMEAVPEKGGCLRTGLIGCGVVALLLLLIFVGGVLYVRKNPGALVDFALRGIEKNYGPDVTEEDKRDLHAAVGDFKEAIRSGRVRQERSMGWQRSFTMKSSSGKLSHEDIRDLIRAFREAIDESRLPQAVPTLAPIAVPTPSP